MSSSSSTRSSSSSSGDIIREGKSSLVFQTPIRTQVRAMWSATLDLDLIDVKKARSTAWQYIDMSGNYAGFIIKTAKIRVEDGAKFTIIVTPRRLAPEEHAITSSWQEALLGRVRAALKEIRDRYEADASPGGTPVGHLL